MIIIAFSKNTSKIFPRIACRRLRHCAPIICDNNNLIMYQFINPKHIIKIKLHQRDLALLRAHGWRFIYISPNKNVNIDCIRACSCVDLSKQVIGIHSIFIQTPYGLYKYLVKK